MSEVPSLSKRPPSIEASLDRLTNQLDVLLKDIKDLRNDVSRIDQASSHTRRSTRILSVAVVLLLLTGSGIGYTVVRVQSYLHCLSSWAQEVTERTDILSDLSSDRTRLLDVLVRDVNPAHPADPVTGSQDYQAYLHASDSYNKASASHPVPKSPTLQCDLFF